MFLDACIQPDAAFLKTWKEIIKDPYTLNKQGRTPLWYRHLKDTPQNLRLNIKH